MGNWDFCSEVLSFVSPARRSWDNFANEYPAVQLAIPGSTTFYWFLVWKKIIFL